MIRTQKVYPNHDAVHLMKNNRNDLLNYKRSIFPSFKFDGFKDSINITGEEIKWKFFHEDHEKDTLLEANLRKVSQLTTKIYSSGQIG